MRGKVAPDRTGERYGRLTVVRRAQNTKQGKAAWECRCDCGNLHIATAACLRAGGTSSCGCLHREIATQCGRATRRHGHSRNHSPTPTYNSWRGMMDRCSNPNAVAYRHYGGRGIKVCDRWQIFENFLADMGERPLGKSIDRIDNDGGYEPGNCRWATPKEQTANRRKKP